MKLNKLYFLFLVMALLLLLSPAVGRAERVESYGEVKFSISEDNKIQVWIPKGYLDVGLYIAIDGNMSGEEGTYYYYRYSLDYMNPAGNTIAREVPLGHYYVVDLAMFDVMKDVFQNYSLKEPLPALFSLEDVKWNGSTNMSWSEVNLDQPKNSVTWKVDFDGYDGQGFSFHRHLEFPVGEANKRHEFIAGLPTEGKLTVSLHAKRGGMVSQKTTKTLYIPMKPLSGLTAEYTGNPPTIKMKWQPSDNKRQDAVEIERTNPDGSKTTIINEYYEDQWTDDQNFGHIEANKLYKYRIRAISKVDAGYNSAWSDQITISTMVIKSEIFQQVVAASQAPTEFLATAKSNSRIDLAWVDRASEETGFAIERTGPDDSVVMLVAPKDATSYSDTGLLPGSTYSYRVKAVIGNDSSPYSASDNATTFELESLSEIIKVMVNGQKLALDVSPVVIEGRTLVPMRSIFEAMGAQVEWNSEERKITAKQGDVSIELQIGNKQAIVNGKAVTLEVPPDIIGGRTLVPMRFVSEAMGAGVDWNSSSRTASITSVPQTLLEKLKLKVPANNPPQNDVPSLLPGTKPGSLPVLNLTYDLGLAPESVNLSSGEYVTFSGVLTSAIGSGTKTGLSGKPISLYKVANGERTQIGTVSTSSGGIFSYKYKPSGSGTYIGVYKNSSGEDLAVSNNSVVTVKSLVSIPRVPIINLPL